ncbi:pyruvate kinase, putative [Babesia ovata]|uniref:Pyruvate kinase, putative n=1 Tax=Babesia ovata TaxID=189622 RepID=A0A2H6K720_9APIC|nr:pyruvate kinase, putative [Babesia ovata]GBE58779.1 pyruvate kinase, putative [Babesia ovata]
MAFLCVDELVGNFRRTRDEEVVRLRQRLVPYDEVAAHESTPHNLLNDEPVLLEELQVRSVEVVRVDPDFGVPESHSEVFQVVEQLAANLHVPALLAHD